ncbi:hypothetical protein PspR84_04065 [Pseudomonas sp. R84]|nr:hypothetical protein PspR84_04065 [Pseudomonas sp. R84]
MLQHLLPPPIIAFLLPRYISSISRRLKTINYHTSITNTLIENFYNFFENNLIGNSFSKQSKTRHP